MIDEALAFDCIKVGTDIGKIFLIIASYGQEGAKDNDEYWQIIDRCNEIFDRLSMNYKMDGNNFIESAPEDISRHFTEPSLSIKKDLYDIGYHLMILGLINLGEETEETEKKNLYDVFKALLNNLQIPTYDLLELLFDNSIDYEKRMYLFSFYVCKHFNKHQNNTEDRIKYKIKNRDGVVIVGDNNFVENNYIHSITFNDNEDLFNNLMHVLKNEKEIDEKVLKIVAEMKDEIGSKKYISKYKEFISAMADHITIIAPFISCLSNLLN